MGDMNSIVPYDLPLALVGVPPKLTERLSGLPNIIDTLLIEVILNPDFVDLAEPSASETYPTCLSGKKRNMEV
jgi:hypothetical protein